MSESVKNEDLGDAPPEVADKKSEQEKVAHKIASQESSDKPASDVSKENHPERDATAVLAVDTAEVPSKPEGEANKENEHTAGKSASSEKPTEEKQTESENVVDPADELSKTGAGDGIEESKPVSGA